MITPSQLKEHEFKNAGRNAYKAEEVDGFLAELTADYEKMYRENGDLIKRASLLADRLEKYKSNAGDITSAVVGAQKAADMIIREAQNSAAAEKAEADAVLNAAKSEAQIIKSDAEKQAIADSELLLSMTRDKAQEIIIKAKKEAEDIIAEARASAGDRIGVATRTVTSETILYDMLKKEVSEFKANILSQYKAHIELISKLPEFAIDEARKNDPDYIPEDEPAQTESRDYEAEAAQKASEIFDSVVKTAEPEPDEMYSDDIISVDDEELDDDTIIKYIKDMAEESQNYENEALTEKEEVVETKLPYGFFGEEPQIEYISDDITESAETESDIDIDVVADIDGKAEAETENSPDENEEFTVEVDSFELDSFSGGKENKDEKSDGPQDIPISRPAQLNKDAFEIIHAEEMQDGESASAEPRKKVFFKRKK